MHKRGAIIGCSLRWCAEGGKHRESRVYNRLKKADCVQGYCWAALGNKEQVVGDWQ